MKEALDLHYIIIQAKKEFIKYCENNLDKSENLNPSFERLNELIFSLNVDAINKKGKPDEEYVRICETEFDKWSEVLEIISYIFKTFSNEDFGITGNSKFRKVVSNLTDIANKCQRHIQNIIDFQICTQRKIELTKRKKKQTDEYRKKGIFGKTIHNIKFFFGYENLIQTEEEENMEKWKLDLLELKSKISKFQIITVQNNVPFSSNHCFMIGHGFTEAQIKIMEKESDIQIYKTQLEYEFKRQLRNEQEKIKRECICHCKEVVVPKLQMICESEIFKIQKEYEMVIKIQKTTRDEIGELINSALEEYEQHKDIDYQELEQNILSYKLKKHKMRIEETFYDTSSNETIDVVELCKSKLPLLAKHFEKEKFGLCGFWYNNDETISFPKDMLLDIKEVLKRGNILVMCEAENNFIFGIFVQPKVFNFPHKTPQVIGVDFTNNFTFYEEQEASEIASVHPKNSRPFLSFGNMLSIRRDGVITSSFLDNSKTHQARTISIYQFR